MGQGLTLTICTEGTVLPAHQYVSDGSPLDRAVAAESETRLAVDVLRVANVRAIIALVDGHIYPRSFRVRLQIKIINKPH